MHKRVNSNMQAEFYILKLRVFVQVKAKNKGLF